MVQVCDKTIGGQRWILDLQAASGGKSTFMHYRIPHAFAEYLSSSIVPVADNRSEMVIVCKGLAVSTSSICHCALIVDTPISIINPISQITGGWICLYYTSSWTPASFTYMAVRKTAGSYDIQCLSLNGKNCPMFQSEDGCNTCIAEFPENTLEPLTCGAMHLEVWKAAGYGDPTHWCETAQNVLGPKGQAQ